MINNFKELRASTLSELCGRTEGIKSLAAIKPIHIKCTYDDGEIEGDFLFGSISNSFSVGGIVKYDKTPVQLNDGEFEVFLIKNPDNVLKLQPIIDGILKHEFNREGIEFFKTKSLTVETNEDLSWTLDGEFAETNGKVEINNLQKAITFIVP
jgi:diacylglycerol kinase family enzyme